MADALPVPGLTILAAGDVGPDQFAALAPFCSSIEVIDLQIAPTTPMVDARGLINRAIDASPHPWVLLLREMEVVEPPLAGEIAGAVGEKPPAWGYRLRQLMLYGGKPLLVPDAEGEIRLFHRRHCRFDPRSKSEEMKVEGPVIRMANRLRVNLYRSVEEHRSHLQTCAVPHSTLRRLLLFTHAAVVSGALFRSPATLRYFWIEAGFDRG
jgi:hypothetical protein